MKTTTTQTATVKEAVAQKRFALYARVSTEEQTRGNYPSCDSQIEELEATCLARGWKVHSIIKDEGISAGSLKRPGLNQVRWMVCNEEIDGLLCTWYDRLTRSRGFYVLDEEFQRHNVRFVTLHDPADTRTASGRFMESMLVAAKTYEREQTSEKVRTKMRQRQEKGLHQGGLVPVGFSCHPETKLLMPDAARKPFLEQMFRHYVETGSDFAVRDWLKAHGEPSPRGEAVWRVSSIRSLLTNRRYVAEIEINRGGRAPDGRPLDGLPEEERYRVVPAPHEPLVPRELFEMSQAVRHEKAGRHPNRKGRPRGYSQNVCQRVYPLQGILTCGICGHAMSPSYVHHKAGTDKSGTTRNRDSYIFHYVCARQQMHGRAACGHTNRILARTCEAWVLEKMAALAQEPVLLERAFALAQQRSVVDTQPQQDALAKVGRAQEENRNRIDQLTEAVSSGSIGLDLLSILNEKARTLKLERESLRLEARHLEEALVPLDTYFEAEPLRETLKNFSRLAQHAEPTELHRLLRLTVRRVGWMPDGSHSAEFYALPQPKSAQPKVARLEAARPESTRLEVAAYTDQAQQKPETTTDREISLPDPWFYRNVQSDTPGRI